MSGYYEYLTSLWQDDRSEFVSQALKLMGQLSPEEQKHILELAVRSLPEDLLKELLKKKTE